MKKLILGVVILFGAIALFIVLSIVPKPAEEDCLVKMGTVSYIFEGGEKDIVFQLQETKSLFYINRGLENGLDIPDLRQKLLGEKITIKYPDYWAPLDPTNSIKHISKLEYGEEVIYSELE